MSARILVPLDGSKLAEQALAHVNALARVFDAEIALLHVNERAERHGVQTCDEFDWALRDAEAKAYLEQVRERLQTLEVPVECHVVAGHPAEAIVEFARAHRVDLIVLTAYGHGGITQFAHGSTAQKVISRARQSLLLVRPSTEDAGAECKCYRRVLVAYDGSHRSGWALRLAAAIALAEDAELVIVRVVLIPQTPAIPANAGEAKKLIDQVVGIAKSAAQRELDSIRAQLPTGINARSEIVVAAAASPVLAGFAASDDIGLLVLSAHGAATDDSTPHGPVCEVVLSHSNRSVLVLQDAGGEAPAFQPRPPRAATTASSAEAHATAN